MLFQKKTNQKTNLKVWVIIAIMAVFSFSHFTQANVNKQINYQGKLTSNTGVYVPDGDYDVVFKLYTVSSGGTAIWTGNYNDTNGNPVPVAGGIMNVLLGSGPGNSLDSINFTGDTYYLGITINTDAEMTPRKRLGAAPQAINSNSLIGDGLIRITGSPVGSSLSEGTVYINPQTVNSGETLLGIAVNGAQRFKVDEQGNVTTAGSLTASGNLMPSADDTYDLGSPTRRWRDFYLGPTSLHIGEDGDDAIISYNTVTDMIEFSKVANINIDAAGLTGEVTSANGGTGIDTSSSTGLPTLSSGTWSIASNLGVTLGGTGTTTQFTPGSLVFAGTNGVYSQDNGNLFWDNGSNRLGIGTSSPSTNLHVISTTEQMRLGYDASNYFSTTVGSSGGVTFNAVGTGQGFTFSDGITITGDLSMTGNIIPTSNDLYDLGSDSNRFRDLFLGGDSLHVGTSTTDEGLMSYDTTNNIFNFGTDATSNGDIAFNANQLYIDKSVGNVGIGTTAPSAKLHAIGTTEQLRLGYDTSNYLSTTVDASGKVTLDSQGTDSGVSLTHQESVTHSEGSRDQSFFAGSFEGANGRIRDAVLQSDGKIIIGGDFTEYEGVPRNYLARLNADGSLDESFAQEGTGLNAYVRTIAIQTDGNILVGGNFTSHNGNAQNYIARFNANGKMDISFNIGGVGFNGEVRNIVANLTDGKMVVGGNFTSYNGTTVNYISRLNMVGTLDTSFIFTGTGLNGAVNSIYTSGLSTVLVGGEFTNYNGTTQNYIARLTSAGALDATFAPTGTGLNGIVYDVEYDSNSGDYLVVGAFTSYNAVTQNKVIRLNSVGTKDTGFSVGTGFSGGDVYSLTKANLSYYIFSGSFTSYKGSSSKSLIKIAITGTAAAPLFDAGAQFYGQAGVSIYQADGRILAFGNFTAYDNFSKKHLARFNSDHTLDDSFLPSRRNALTRGAAAQSDGKWFVWGDGSGKNVIRLNANGTPDETFSLSGTGFNGPVYAASIRSDGKIVVGGNFTSYNGTARNYIARLNPDGTLDNDFYQDGTGLDGAVNAIYIKSDGDIMVGGNFTSYNGTTRNYIARLNTNGDFDSGFTPTGTGLNGAVNTLYVKSDGDVMVGGSFTSYNGTTANYAIRLNAAGTIDVGFAPAGTGLNGAVNIMSAQTDGKILFGGAFTSYNGTARNYIARLNSDGTLDTSFAPTGTGLNDQVRAIVSKDGKIIIGGNFTNYNGTARNYIARIAYDGSLDTTFVSEGSGLNGVVRSMALQDSDRIMAGGDFTSYDGEISEYVASFFVRSFSGQTTLIVDASGLGISNKNQRNLLSVDNETGNVSIGENGPSNEKLSIDGMLSLKEQASNPEVSPDYGKIYAKSDNNLYYQDDSGNEFGLNRIKQLSEEFLVSSNENISAGDVVSFVEERIKKGSNVISYGEEKNLGDLNSQYTKIRALDATRFVILSESGSVVIGSISGTTISYGEIYDMGMNIGYNGADSYSMCVLDSSTFLIAYFNDVVLGHVSGTSVYLDKNNFQFNQSSNYNVSIASLDAGHFVVAYGNTARIGRVNGNDIYYGDEYDFSISGTGELSVAAFDSNSFVLIYNGTALIGQVAGDVIAYGIGYDFQIGAMYTSVDVLSPTTFVVAYALSGGTASARIGSVAGTVIVFGVANIFNTTVDDTNNISVVSSDATHFVISYIDVSLGYYGVVRIGAVSGTTISSYGAASNFNAFDTTSRDPLAIASLDATHFVVTYVSNKGASTYPSVSSASKVGLTSGTAVSSYGAEKILNYPGTQAYPSIDAIALDSTRFVITYSRQNSSTSGMDAIAVVGTVSGSTITYGLEYVFNSVVDGWMTTVSIAAFSSTSFVVAYTEEPASTSLGKVRIASVSGSVITFGTESTFKASHIMDWVKVSTVSTTRFVVAYYDDVTYQNLTRVGLISGTTVSSYGAESDSGYFPDRVVGLDATHFLINEGNKIKIALLSGSTVSSYGTEMILPHSSIAAIAKLDTTHLIVAFSDGKTRMLLYSGDKILSYGEASDFSSSSSSAFITVLSTSKFLIAGGEGVRVGVLGNSSMSIAYSGGSDMYNGNIVALNATSFISVGESVSVGTIANNYLGVAQEDCSGGEMCRVALGGISNVHTNLESGVAYYANESGTLTTTDTGYKVGLAISSTEIVLQSQGSTNQGDMYFGDMIFANAFRITEEWNTPMGLIFQNQLNQEIMRIDGDGNLTLPGSMIAQSLQVGNNIFANSFGNFGIGSSNFGTGAQNVFTISGSTAPTTSITDGIQLFAVDQSGSHELRVRDEAGNVTTLSPHNFSTIPGGASEELAWAYYSEKDNKSINVDMTKVVRLIENLTGEKLIYTTDMLTGQDIDMETLMQPIKIQEDVATLLTSVSELNLKTSTNVSNIAELQDSIDEQLETVETNFNQQSSFIGELDNTVKILQSQIIELQNQTNQELNIAQIDQNTTDISYLKTLLGINSNKPNEISIMGKLIAENIETGIMTIKAVDEEKATIGTATICPIGKGIDAMGKCTIEDLNGDGKSVVVRTGAVSKEAKVFTSFENNPKTSSWIEKVRDVAGDYNGFIIHLDGSVEEAITVNWWIVEAK